MNIFSVIFMNFWGFDIIIFLAAIFNGFVFYMVKTSADKLRGHMTHTIYVPHFNLSRREADRRVSELHEEDVLGLRAAMDRFYALFVNITGIFPLLGILGTVVSLLGLVSDMENVTGNFYGALTSTFWGLIFAILFKFLDGVISPEIESNEKSVRLYLESNSGEEAAARADTAPEAAGTDPAPVSGGDESGDAGNEE
ncbi:MAG: MotA/TolQ/ExbB proton channel family protein [Ruminiclostridium sp.]|nr:MotA/TolQ/ExbB proton channel family protein [Ruminiclostridium sp.]